MSEQAPSSDMPEPLVTGSGGLGNRTTGGLQHRFVDVLGWLITFAWGISFVLDAAVKEYEPPVSVHALMMVVAGAAFGSSLIKKGEGQ